MKFLQRSKEKTEHIKDYFSDVIHQRNKTTYITQGVGKRGRRKF